MTGSVDVEIWTFELDVPVAERDGLRALLDRQERARMDRLLSPILADRFAVAHGRMRQILGETTATRPDRLAFSRGPFGKPYLDGNPLEFSLSHTGGFAALAVASCAIGIDIEERRDLERPGVSLFFSDSERAQLAALDHDAWRAALLRCWTRKEAVCKAAGCGLKLALDGFSVTCLEDDPPGLTWMRGDPEAPRSWRVFDLDMPNDYVGALAARRSDLQIRYRRI